jgi:hypothetical protein
MNIKHKLFVIGFIFLFSFAFSSWALRPVPPASTPQIVLIKGDAGKIQFEDFKLSLKINGDQARIKTYFLLSYNGQQKQEYLLKFIINDGYHQQRKIKVYYNQNEFSYIPYSKKHEKLTYVFAPGDELAVKIDYIANIGYIFAKKKDAFIGGSKILIEPPLMAVSLDNQQTEQCINSAGQKMINAANCFYNLQIPFGYSIYFSQSPDKWNIEKKEEALNFRLEEKDCSCYLEIYRRQKEKKKIDQKKP